MSNLSIRWFFPIAASLLVFILGCNEDNSDPQPNTPNLDFDLAFVADSFRFENSGLSMQCTFKASASYTILRKGICYGRSTLTRVGNGNFTSNGNAAGNYTARLEGVNFSETWFVRPYVISVDAASKTDTTYGKEISFSATHTFKNISLTESAETSFLATSSGLKANIMPGLGQVLSKGFCWSRKENPYPVSGFFVASPANDTLPFSFRIENLEPGQIWYVRAYAVSAADTSFSPNFRIGTSFRDAESNLYPIVQIGSQIWMAENLQSTRFRDGSSLLVNPGNTEWNSALQPACSQATGTFGRMYNQLAITDPRLLCPAGWTMPGQKDWDTLFTALGGWDQAGLKLKANTTAWGSSILTGQGTSGFLALPAGMKDSTGTQRSVNDLGLWWALPEGNKPAGLIRIDRYNDEAFSAGALPKSGYAVRCFRKE
jgi:uncharacterized protein (TIGR02145 family)